MRWLPKTVYLYLKSIQIDVLDVYYNKNNWQSIVVNLNIKSPSIIHWLYDDDARQQYQDHKKFLQDITTKIQKYIDFKYPVYVYDII